MELSQHMHKLRPTTLRLVIGDLRNAIAHKRRLRRKIIRAVHQHNRASWQRGEAV